MDAASTSLMILFDISQYPGKEAHFYPHSLSTMVTTAVKNGLFCFQSHLHLLPSGYIFYLRVPADIKPIVDRSEFRYSLGSGAGENQGSLLTSPKAGGDDIPNNDAAPVDPYLVIGILAWQSLKNLLAILLLIKD